MIFIPIECEYENMGLYGIIRYCDIFIYDHICDIERQCHHPKYGIILHDTTPYMLGFFRGSLDETWRIIPLGMLL